MLSSLPFNSVVKRGENSSPLVLLTRPLETIRKTQRIFEKSGYQTVVEPLLKISFTPSATFTAPIPHTYLVTTSQYAIRALDCLKQHHLPLMCVGNTSKELAQQLGFTQLMPLPETENAEGLLKCICKTLPPSVSLLYVHGDRLAYDLKHKLEKKGYRNVQTWCAYHTNDATLFTPETLSLLRQQAFTAVTFYSVQTTKVFKQLCSMANIDLSQQTFYPLCLSTTIATELPAPLKERAIISSSTEDLIKKLHMS